MKKDDFDNLTEGQREIAKLMNDIFSIALGGRSFPSANDAYRGAGKTKSREQMLSEMDKALDEGNKDRYIFLCKQFNVLYGE
jgi:hypothetical protein